MKVRQEQQKQKIFEQQRKNEEEQRRIEAERLQIEKDQRMLDEEQKRMDDMMNRSPSSSPDNYYTCEIKVCSSPFPSESPMTIPSIVTQEPKSESPELYFTSDVKVTLSPYSSPMTVPNMRQMNSSPFLNNRSSYHESSGAFLQHQEQSSTVNKSQQRHSMYETAASSTHQSQSMQSINQSFSQSQQSTTFQQQNTIPPTQKALPLQPMGGRADATAQPDQDDPSSSVSS